MFISSSLLKQIVPSVIFTDNDCFYKKPGFIEMIEFLLKVKSNALYFCNAGKDRTGVVSVVLLYKLGMSPEYIIADYLKSKDNLESVLKSYAEKNPQININVITPQKRYIEEFMSWYIKR